jgi:hypothetical protein
MENVEIKSAEMLRIFKINTALVKTIASIWSTRNVGTQSIVVSHSGYFVRFYISFENAICKDYITEKTFNALKLNTIPIVLGGVNYMAELPPGSFINAAQFVSPQG